MASQKKNLVCITGDVHHQSLATREAPFIDPLTEIQLAREYIDIATRHGLKVTLFVTGKTLKEEWADFQKLQGSPNVEFGAHTYSAFQPLWFHRTTKLFTGSYWLNKHQQRRDIERTVQIFNQRLGSVRSWRTHSYEYDKYTATLLTEAGFEIWSDVMDKSIFQPSIVAGTGLISLPINIREDHSGFFHGFLTREEVSKKQSSIISNIKNSVRGRKCCETTVVDGAVWEEGFMSDVFKATDAGVAVMNLHPVCMYLLDRFKTFDRLCANVAQYESLFVSEACERYFPKQN